MEAVVTIVIGHFSILPPQKPRADGSTGKLFYTRDARREEVLGFRNVNAILLTCFIPVPSDQIYDSFTFTKQMII